MSTLPLYDSTIGVSTHAAEALRGILKKAQAHADAASFPQARLYEDMRPLTFQVQMVSNVAKKMVERLAGRQLDAWEDNEQQTMDELVARVDKTLALLATVKPDDVDGATAKSYDLQLSGLHATATAEQYVLGYALPNLFFHLSVAYAILRMKGVELGKRDYLAPFVQDVFSAGK